MVSYETPAEALAAAINAAGSQSQFARDLNVYQSKVWRWVKEHGKLPAEYVLTVERLYGVPRHDLRPDIYPVDLPSPGRFFGVDQGIRPVSFQNRRVSKRGVAA